MPWHIKPLFLKCIGLGAAKGISPLQTFSKGFVFTQAKAQEDRLNRYIAIWSLYPKAPLAQGVKGEIRNNKEETGQQRQGQTKLTRKLS